MPPEIPRRELLKAAAYAGLSLPLLGLKSSPMPEETRPAAKRNFVWTGVDHKATDQALKTKYHDLKSHGITGVFLGGGIDDREFGIVRESGLELHTWMWTTNRGDEWIRKNHPDWYQVSRTGKSCFDQPPYVDYYRWISPVIPGVQRYLEDRVDELAKHEAVTGVHLDYVRYPDVILPRALWEHYHLDQTNELPDYDFCYSKHTRDAFKRQSGRDPMDIADPAHDQEWLHFRYDSVTELVKKLTKVAHDHHKQITAAVFPTPHMARKICRQDWDKWPLDAFCPMIYHSFYNEKVPWIGDCVLENIHSVQAPIFAGLYMPAFEKPEEFAEGLKVARFNGATGVSLFGGIDAARWEVFEKWVAE
ncbi:MAG TPA: family 10 glycosylhydrolase [Fimbriimonas sp.]|nr:family 10 glycosylhydrolase [Fimbriimonas sp.]